MKKIMFLLTLVLGVTENIFARMGPGPNRTAENLASFREYFGWWIAIAVLVVVFVFLVVYLLGGKKQTKKGFEYTDING